MTEEQSKGEYFVRYQRDGNTIRREEQSKMSFGSIYLANGDRYDRGTIKRQEFGLQ